MFVFFFFFLYYFLVYFFFFFFQAEDGIRDTSVTGVQTCALPISLGETAHRGLHREAMLAQAVALRVLAQQGEGFLAVHRRDAITERPAPVVAEIGRASCRERG